MASYDWFGDWLTVYKLMGWTINSVLLPDTGLSNKISWDLPHDSIASHPSPLLGTVPTNYNNDKPSKNRLQK